VTFAFLAGLFIAYTILLQKIGLMLRPLVLFLFVDNYISSGRGFRKKVCLTAAVIIAAALLTFFPALIGAGNEGINPNIEMAMAKRRQSLVIGLKNEALKIGSMVIDSFYQLQVHMFDIPRHLWMLEGPILDPLSSILFSVGMVFAVLFAFSKRECRLQLAGLLIFILPMALSYPLDSEGPHGLARRMVGASFFVAWIASYGAEVLASRLVSSTNVARVCVMLGSMAMVINLRHLGASYWDLKKTVWISDEGGARAVMIKESRQFARAGYKTVVLNEHHTTINGMNYDLPNLHVALNLKELRQMVASPHDNEWLVVIMPSGRLSGEAPAHVQQLADIIPPNEWIFGPADITGVPMLRYVTRPPAHGGG